MQQSRGRSAHIQAKQACQQPKHRGLRQRLSQGKKAEARTLYNKVLLIRPGDTQAIVGLKRL
jgi:hypothetical protein